MPILAQVLIPINITDQHEIVINRFKECNCLNKNELLNSNDDIKDKILNVLDSLTSQGLITCTDDKCCINSNSYNSFLDKLNKLKK